MLINSITIIQWAILWYFIALSYIYLMLLIVSVSNIFTRFKEFEISNIISLTKSNTLPPVSIIMSAYCEQDIIIDSVKSILNSDYPQINSIIVNDGSTDNTLQKLIDEFQFYSVSSLLNDTIPIKGKIKGYYISKTYKNLILIDKTHTDKSDSLNVGINACCTPLFASIDADTLVEPDAINRIMFYFLSLSHPMAVGGAVYILNGCVYQKGKIISQRMSHKPIHIFQTCEYLRSFLFSRSGWNALDGALCYAGAFTLINHHEVIKIGGYDINNAAQDFEIITHLHRLALENKLPYNISYTPAAIAWTAVPNNLKEYWKQRFNWQYYSLKSLMLHVKMLFNPKYGRIGMFTYPFYLFGETLGATVEFLAYVIVIISGSLGILNIYWTVLFFILCWGFSTFLTIATSLMNMITFNEYRKKSDLLLILIFSILENFGFRQYNVLCRTIATLKYCGDRLTARYF